MLRSKLIWIVTVTGALLGAAVSQKPASGGTAAKPSAASANHDSPFACNRFALTTEARKRHFDELGPNLRARVKGVKELPEGYAFELPNDAVTYKMLSEWVDGERLCCPFFDIAIEVEREGGPLWLNLSGRKGTKEFVKADLGGWMKSASLPNSASPWSAVTLGRDGKRSNPID